MTIVITSSNFNRTLTSVMKSEGLIRDKIGALIGFGITHYAESVDANPLYLTKIMEKATAEKSRYQTDIKRFVTAACNVQYTKNKNGDMIFKKVKDAAKAVVDNDVMAELPTWFEYGKVKKDDVPKFTNSNFRKKAETLALADAQELAEEQKRIEAYLKLVKQARKLREAA